MKPHEMREMTLEELKMLHDSLEEELANLMVKLSVKQLDNPLKVRTLRREIARVKTILREKEMDAMAREKRAAGTNDRTEQAGAESTGEK